MSVIAAGLMLGMAPSGAVAGTYDCIFDKMLIAYRATSEWGVTDQGTPNNSHAFKKLTLTVSPDNKVNVGLPAASLNLSGSYTMTPLASGQYSWSSAKPAYCGVVDAMCVATADLHLGVGGGKPALAIHFGVEIGDGAAKSIGTIQFLYSCERQA